ncbi:hypothetical protein INS49_010559 [Diaporthe citri]|uniref:uncharacterized protein n=1 Tax=Diaporthe citri TaxID=83186 RepID=UPI001C8147DE|nr:uncharacterized protein INS49_010559 [Diaporthe citri]KAG6362329.1 hypothetical protein INS49_010559 [Diaporthe citri]
MSDSIETSSLQSGVSQEDMGSNVDNLQESASQDDQCTETPIQPPPTNPQYERLWIRYRTEYRDQKTNSVVWEKNSRTPIDDGPDGIGSMKDPIFEVLTTYRARGDNTTEKRSSRTDNTEGKDPPPRSFGTPAAYKLRIYSTAIRNALNSVVRYYPSQSLAGDVLEIKWPYPVLVHHYDPLVEFREQVLLQEPSDLCVREAHAAEDIQALLSYLDQTVMDDIKAEISRLERGCVSFDNLWFSHKPGTTVLKSTRENPHWRAWVIKEVDGGTFVDPPGPWIIRGWSLAFNGLHLDRVRQSIKCYEILCRFIPDTTDINDEEAKRLIDYGKSYWNLVQKQCKYHFGDSSTFPFNKVEGLVMTDMQQYYTANSRLKPDFLDGSDLRRWISDCICAVCRMKSINLETSAQSIFEKYCKKTRLTSPKLTDHQYLLCPFEIPAFVFKTRTWDTFHVKNFREPQFQQKMIDSLVTDKDRVTTLKALAESFIRVNQDGDTIERQAWTADFVKGKGNGITFLLHGRPGVGKTYTAECIAEYTRRPLMTLTSSDIGTDPSLVELNLMKHFKTARSWGAILLIDEADVFMERRSSNDLTRNSLVAGFLRALEFYDGLLFLTTNRVGAFDDAFISRIHVKLYYRDFTDSERQDVWKTFIDKLHSDSTDSESGKVYMRVSLPAQEYIEGDQIRAIRWNGREIRNAFQTAVALAEHENKQDREGTILVTERHLKSILALSKDFKNYLAELNDGRDEEMRAQVRRERLDDFEDASGPRR